MTEHKFTDEQIIKALECCAVDPHSGKFADCKNCPLDYSKTANCFEYEIQIIALDLINRQRAEIEAWETGQKALQKNLSQIIRAEAIKEFAEKLKEELTTGAAVMRVSTLDIIDCLVKEMTEGKQ